MPLEGKPDKHASYVKISHLVRLYNFFKYFIPLRMLREFLIHEFLIFIISEMRFSFL